MFRLIIAGGRDFANYELLREYVDFKLSRKQEEIQIISGGARGADALGERYAAERGYLLRRFLPIGNSMDGRQGCGETKKWHRMRTL